MVKNSLGRIQKKKYKKMTCLMITIKPLTVVNINKSDDLHIKYS